jgi:hypothetical protein
MLATSRTLVRPDLRAALGPPIGAAARLARQRRKTPLFEASLLPRISATVRHNRPSLSIEGYVRPAVAFRLLLKAGIPGPG